MKVDISMKEILVYVVRRWKIIIAFALVVAMVIGWAGYNNKAPKVPDVTPELNETLASKEGNDNYTDTTVKLSLGIDLTNFVGTSGDSYHITLATNDLLTKVANRYLLIAQGAQYTEILKDIVTSTVSENELHDYIRVESPTIVVIDIVVSGFNDVDSSKVASAVYDYLLSFNAVIGESIAEHALTFIARSFSESSPDEGETTVSTVVSSPINSALVAFLAGLVVATLVAAVLYLVRLPIQVPDQIQQQLGIKYIGGFRKKNNLSLGDRIAGSLRIADRGEAMGLIFANLKSLIGDHSRILVTGSIDEESVKKFAEKIALVNDQTDIVFSTGSDINKSASGVSALMDCDAVVLVERIDHSKLRHIKEEKDRINMSGKDIIGYVLY